MMAWGAVGLVVVIIVALVIVKATGSSSGNASYTPVTPAPASVVHDVTTIPESVYNTVGINSPTIPVSPPIVVKGQPALTLNGKTPSMLYVGAEYCPYCAAERWALAVALSRFGTFSNLSGTHSSDSDVYPDTQTLSFYGSSYTSAYIDFQPVEEATNQPAGDGYQTLQTPTAAQSALVAKYDPQGSIPFLDIANRYLITGSSFSPQVLQGLSRSQIAADLSDPGSAVAQAIDGTANDITAAIAAVTGNQPSSVASSATIAAIAQNLQA